MKNPAAVALGKMAKGVPKNFSRAELARRKKLMDAINKNRREKSREARMPNEPSSATRRENNAGAQKGQTK